MARDLHKKPFDEGTHVKLALFRNYVESWLPVFLQKGTKFHSINIFDFFCGPGKDKNDAKGSPLIILELLNPYFENLPHLGLSVSLFFNDNRKDKITALKNCIADSYPAEMPCDIHFMTEKFEDLFTAAIPIMRQPNTANFLFLDQNGIKHITKEVFQTIISIPTTDFLFFISSSTLKRFNDNSDIRGYVDIPESEISSTQYCHIHRKVLDYYRSLIPSNQEYYLCPFSLKKGGNIYGLIFGSGHMLGIDKFVNQCWKIDPQTGDSNFDIDRDCIPTDHYQLFPEVDKPKKIEEFESQLKNAIQKGFLKTNIDVYKFALFRGFKADQAKKVIRKMIETKDLLKQKINISYSACKQGSQPQILQLRPTK